MSTAAGPKRPKKRPRPKSQKLTGDDIIFFDETESFSVGSTCFVCIDEDNNEFDTLEKGTYCTDAGVTFQVCDGEITQIGQN